MTQNIIYARNTMCLPVEKEKACNFVKQYHKQGMTTIVTNAHCYRNIRYPQYLSLCADCYNNESYKWDCGEKATGNNR